ncbi:hypothetical protein KY289_019677 [Solanum tuberosum]|nr:hypothetical protein KY289_019677 [Solanum tuberosum]
MEEERKVDHLIDIKDTNDQDPLGSQTKKSVNQMFDLDNLSIESSTIFKVNVWLRESNPVAYTPKMVSIGPYHKKNQQLGLMKKYKLLYLRRFLQRKEGLDVESCISELEKQKEEVLKCYNDIEDLDTDNSHEFCQMLLLDGCFVVEFIREYCEMCPKGEEKIININDNYIFRDLMLLENQLPFFVLNQLHYMTKQDDELPLAILVGNRMKKSTDDITWHMVMPNATELSEAGVSFAKVSFINKNKDNIGDMTNLLDIKFEKGLMEIPCFRVEDDTETVLRNLIAYEQQSFDVHPTYFSDYATFMDHLIDSDKDVNLLRQKGIIVNWIGEDKEVASLFNKIGNGVTTYSDFYYKEEFRKAVEHCQKPWNRMQANLKHNYFSSPWVGASTVAAIILLILTTIQTILAITSAVK